MFITNKKNQDVLQRISASFTFVTKHIVFAYGQTFLIAGLTLERKSYHSQNVILCGILCKRGYLRWVPSIDNILVD